MHRELFCVGIDLWDACSIEEIEATVAALKEVGLYGLPYDEVDLEVPGDRFINWVRDDSDEPLPRGLVQTMNKETGEIGYRSNFGDAFVMRFEGLSLLGAKDVFCIDYSTGAKHSVVSLVSHAVEDIAAMVRDVLITVLSTRGVRKNREPVKGRAKLGLGNYKHRKRNDYVTTLVLPEAEGLADHPEHPAKADGRKARHLRRAHLRTQHYGPGMQFAKRILIAATIVNADLEWTRTRTRYNFNPPKQHINPALR